MPKVRNTGMQHSNTDTSLTIIVEDPNIWISYLIGSKYAEIIDFLDDKKLRFLICPEYINELKRVTSRPEFRKWFTEDAANALINIIEQKCETMNITVTPVEGLRDKNDSYLINLAQQGNADVIVSNDKDITEFKGDLGKTKIMTLAQFFHFYKEFQASSTEKKNKGRNDI